jgi:hypothetical protein
VPPHSHDFNLAPDVGADLPGYSITDADRKLDEVYGDHVHDNDGTHLSGGINDDRLWQRYWQQIAQEKPRRYNLPQSKEGKLFLTQLVLELQGVQDPNWNFARIFVFTAVILNKAPNITAALDIKAKIGQHLKLWEKDRRNALIQD